MTELLEMETVQYSTSSGALFTFGAVTEPREEVGEVVSLPNLGSDGMKYKQWGLDNQLPTDREKILRENSLAGELIKTKRDIIAGNGIQPYTESIEDGKRKRTPAEMPQEIADWLRSTAFRKRALLPAIGNMLKHEIFFPHFRKNMKRGTALLDVRVKDCKYIRLGKKVDGEIVNYFYSPDWLKTSKEYDPRQIVASERQKEFMKHYGDDLFNDGYYPIPAYWGSKWWIVTSNKVPIFHNNNLDNGSVIRYHVEYDVKRFLNAAGYSDAKGLEAKKKCAELAKEKLQEFVDKINEYLTGVKNSGKALFTSYEFNKISKEYDGVKITPLNTDTQDTNMLKFFESALKAIVSSMGIHPTIANVETQGKLSSGSEMRNAFNFWVAVKTSTYRSELLDFWDDIMRLNRWDQKYSDLKWGFEDISLAKLDDDKSGTQNVMPESKPDTDNEEA